MPTISRRRASSSTNKISGTAIRGDYPCYIPPSMDSRPPRNPGDQPSAVLTREAFERLRQELEELTTEGRRLVAERLLRAREHGDIRENAEYDAAKDEQGLMEARIRALQRLLKDPDIVQAPTEAEMAGPGILVTLRPLDEDPPEDEVYLLA